MRWLNPFVWWRRLQRAIDRQLLIPAIEANARDERIFALAFGMHVGVDSAWQVEEWELTRWERTLVNRCMPYWEREYGGRK